MQGTIVSWRKENLVEAKSLGDRIEPDFVITQLKTDRKVVKTIIEAASKVNNDFCLEAAPATPTTRLDVVFGKLSSGRLSV
jgi:ribokinase